MKKVFILSFVCFGLISNVVVAGATSQQIQDLRKDVGNKLIEIKKVDPSLEKTVYTLLDQVGTIHKLSGNLIQKRKKIKTAFEEESKEKANLQEENETLKARVKELEGSLSHENTKMSYYQQQCDELTKERTELITRRAELESKEREYQARLKELEKNVQKVHPEGTVALQKTKEVAKVSHPLRDKNPLLAASNKITI